MNPQIIFDIIILIIVFNYLFDRYLNWLNAKNISTSLPKELEEIYDQEKYAKSLAYEKANDKFSFITATFSFIIIMAMLFYKGFAFVD